MTGRPTLGAAYARGCFVSERWRKVESPPEGKGRGPKEYVKIYVN